MTETKLRKKLEQIDELIGEVQELYETDQLSDEAQVLLERWWYATFGEEL